MWLFSHKILSLCDPMDCSLAGSSVYGILQAKVLEWVVISFSRVSFRPRNQTGDLPDPGIEPASPAWQVDSLPLSHQESPTEVYSYVFSDLCRRDSEGKVRGHLENSVKVRESVPEERDLH